MNIHNKFIIHFVLTLISVVAIGLITSVHSQSNETEIRGFKQLNNVMSVAINNGRNSAEFLTIQLPNSILRPPIPSSCSRQLYGIDLFDPSTFVGALARVYNGTLRIGVSNQRDPQLFSVDSSGVATGFLADVSWLVTNQMGMILGKTIVPSFVRFNYTSFFTDTLALLDSGRVDAVIGVYYLASRSVSADFTCIYQEAYPLSAYVDTKVGLPTGIGAIASIEDLNLPNVTASILRGTFLEDAAIRFLPLTKKVYFTKISDVLNAVGRTADFAFFDENEVALYNADNDNRLLVVNNTQTVYTGGQAFVTKKN